MANTLLKRIVSVGSASALAAASLIGFSAPANAAAGLTIEVAEGADYTFVEGASPVFTIAGNADFIASNGSQLRVSLKNMDAVNGTYSAFKINSTTLVSDYSSTNSGNVIAYATAAAALAVAEPADTAGTQEDLTATTAGNVTVFGLGATSQSFGATYSTSAMTSPFTFQFTSATLADNESDTFLMTAWADADNDGAVDAGEISTTREITFIAPEDVTGTVTATTPLSGGNSFTASVSYNVNEAYIDAGDAGIYVTEDATTEAALNLQTTSAGATQTTGIIVTDSGAYFTTNSAKTRFTFTVNPSTNSGTAGLLSTSGQFSVFTIAPLFADDGAVIDEASALVAADKLAAGSVTVRTAATSVSSTESTVNGVRSVNVLPTGVGTAQVRTNTEFVALADFEDTNGANIVGKSVTWTAATSAVLSSSKTVTLNGTTYSSNAALALAEIAATTSATGRTTLTVNSAGLSEDDTITLTATADGIAETLVATMKDAAYTATFLNGSLTTNQGYGKTMTIGGSLNVTLAVADQFGVAPANGVARVTLSRATQNARTTAANWSYTLPVVDGVATGTIVDNGAGAGSDTITATAAGTDVSGTDTFVLTYATSAAGTVTGVTVTDNVGAGDSTVRLNSDNEPLPSWHHFLNTALEPTADASNFKDGATTGTSDTLLTISGTATNAAGVGVAGKVVTISAPGITFTFTDGNSNKIYAKGSIDVVTTSGGAFSVAARSDGKGGPTTITATVDGVSGTNAVTFVAGTATAMNLSVPAAARDGRAIDIIATITDVAGDPVQDISVSFTATGVGYLSNLSGTTDANGRVVVKLITQTDETGAATITATATLDGTSTSTSGTVTVSKAGTAASADQKVNAGSFKGYVAVYAKGYAGDRLSFKAGNDWNVTESLASDFVRVVEFTGAGYTINVPIYINRVLVDTIVVTTK